jgi:thiamine-monophosphate kinase
MKINSIGEFGLIERIKGWVTPGDSSVLIGIGDDAAVVEDRSGLYRLITTDAFVEGVHFKREFATPWQIGWKTMAANLSDIAAMGGNPRWAVVCVVFPEAVSVEEVEELYRGMDAVCSEFGCSIVGGDTSLSPDRILISITVIGEVEKKKLTLRRSAKIGDAICVTGDLGGAQAGLDVLKEKGKTDQKVVERHLEPTPRVNEARTMGEIGRIHAMIDISDGLSSEVHHICRESGVGARLFAVQVPVSPDAKQVASRQGRSPLDYALNGGEDFELLFTVSPGDVERVRSHLLNDTGTQVAIIGEIVGAGKGVVIVGDDGKEGKMPRLGYQHFLD